MSKKYDLSEHILDPHGQIYVGMPRERILIPAFVDNRDNILGHLAKQKRGSEYWQHESHRVDRNRDNIAYRFLNAESKPEWLLMLDTDMEHPVDVGIRLSAWRKPIVGGLYFHRGKTHAPFAFEFEGVGKTSNDVFNRDRLSWRPMSDTVYDFLQENRVPRRDGSVTIGEPGEVGLIEVDAVATGAMLIHRSVLETMEPPWFEYREGGYSEDLMFCKIAKDEYDIPIHCDLSTISGHYKWQPMGQGQFQSIYEGRGVNITLYSVNEIVEDFAKYHDIPEEEARENIENGNAHMVGAYWRSKKPKTPQEVRDFYKDPHTGWLYNIELIHWNRTPSFDYIKKQLMSVREKKVVEVGSGIGTIAMQLAIQRNHVLSLEVNDTLCGFAQMRWNKIKKLMNSRHGQIDYIDALKEVPDDYADLVVAIDVIEHLPKEDARKVVLEAGRVLKPNEGGLMFHNNWAQQDLYPMHYDWSEYWESWLAEAGMIQISPFRAIKVNIPTIKHENIEKGEDENE